MLPLLRLHFLCKLRGRGGGGGEKRINIRGSLYVGITPNSVRATFSFQPSYSSRILSNFAKNIGIRILQNKKN